MSNDIVNRLRESEWNEPQTNIRLCGESADEIERLRAELDSWRNLAKLARKSWHTDSWLDFDKAYTEAVRGD